jgi:hypothetical protein
VDHILNHSRTERELQSVVGELHHTKSLDSVGVLMYGEMVDRHEGLLDAEWHPPV